MYDSSIQNTDSQSRQSLHTDSNKLWSNRTGRFLGNQIDSNRFVKWITQLFSPEMADNYLFYSNRESECTSYQFEVTIDTITASGNVTIVTQTRTLVWFLYSLGRVALPQTVGLVAFSVIEWNCCWTLMFVNLSFRTIKSSIFWTTSNRYNVPENVCSQKFVTLF